MPMKVRAVKDDEGELEGCEGLTTSRGKARKDMHISQNFSNILKVRRYPLSNLGQLVQRADVHNGCLGTRQPLPTLLHPPRALRKNRVI